MRPQRRRRLVYVLLMISCVSVGTLMVTWSLRQNINLYYTPSQVFKGQMNPQRDFRVGGVVVKGSVKHAMSGLMVAFALTDFSHQILIHYQGLLPTLFKEGQGIVVKGRFDKQGQFQARQVLAKHDENYMPPEVRDSLKKGAMA